MVEIIRMQTRAKKRKDELEKSESARNKVREQQFEKLVSECEQALDSAATGIVSVRGLPTDVVQEVIAKYRKAGYKANLESDEALAETGRLLISIPE